MSEPWPKYGLRKFDDHVYAIGILQLNWSVLEEMFGLLTHKITGGNINLHEITFNLMGNVE